MPTLAEALDFAFGRIGAYLELKESDDDGALKKQILESAKGHPDYLRWGYLMDVAGFNVCHTSLDEGRLAAFHCAGKSVAVWTVNDEPDMRRLADWGVDGIITDRPDLCKTVLAARGK